MPVHCVSDNWPQFRSEEFTRFLKMNGVKHVRVAPYHAASNGLAERMVQSFKNHMKVCKDCKLSIQQRIENFLLTYRSTKHPTTGTVAERSGPRSYVVVLSDGRVWKRHVDHVRRDSMDRAVSDPSREMESQDKPPDIALAIPLDVCVPDPATSPSVLSLIHI